MAALVNDASICYETEFHASTFMTRAAAEGATMRWGVGPMGMAILAQAESAADRDFSFRLASWTPMRAEDQLDFERRFNTPVIAEGYGQTECTPVSINTVDGARKRGSAGRAVPHFELKIVDDDDVEVPTGEVGEIVVRPRRPDAMFQGYWNNAEATVGAFRNLWHHTGDWGTVDQDGFFTFVDRKKDAIRRRGENVSSFQLEEAISGHAAVAQVAVCGVPSPLGEDEIKAWIVPAGAPPAPEEFFDFLKQHVPYFAIPRYVEFRQSLPVNAMGRVMKHLLRGEGVGDDAWDFEVMGLAVDRVERR
jgi:crotonobetaine/carnitine-CoA ligase